MCVCAVRACAERVCVWVGVGVGVCMCVSVCMCMISLNKNSIQESQPLTPESDSDNENAEVAHYLTPNSSTHSSPSSSSKHRYCYLGYSGHVTN